MSDTSPGEPPHIEQPRTDGQPGVDEPRTRTGAHRPHRSALLDLVPAVLVLLAVVAVAVGAWQLTRSTAATVAASGGPDPASVAPQRPGASTAGRTPSDDPSSPTTSLTSSSSPTASLDRGQALSVLNATRTTGLATSAADVLRAADWTIQTTGNYRTASPPTTVFYGQDDQQVTAQAVADDLGGDPAVEQSAQFGADAVTVVLGSDYAG